MAVTIDQRVVEETLIGVPAPHTYQSALTQRSLRRVEPQISTPESNLVSWALSGTYAEDTPVSVTTHKRGAF
jgi:hypothetical protein